MARKKRREGESDVERAPDAGVASRAKKTRKHASAPLLDRARPTVPPPSVESELPSFLRLSSVPATPGFLRPASVPPPAPLGRRTSVPPPPMAPHVAATLTSRPPDSVPNVALTSRPPPGTGLASIPPPARVPVFELPERNEAISDEVVERKEAASEGEGPTEAGRCAADEPLEPLDAAAVAALHDSLTALLLKVVGRLGAMASRAATARLRELLTRWAAARPAPIRELCFGYALGVGAAIRRADRSRDGLARELANAGELTDALLGPAHAAAFREAMVELAGVLVRDLLPADDPRDRSALEATIRDELAAKLALARPADIR